MRHLWYLLLLPASVPAALALPGTAPSAALRAASRAAAHAIQQGDLYIVAHTTALRGAPDTKPLGQLSPGATVELLARDRGWARVRIEGWVREADLQPADTTLKSALSAADLRADPEGTQGKMVQWTVEFLALQTANPLRQGLADDEPYILARGPGNENAILYLVVPPSLLSTARALQPLAKISVAARVREGRSAPAGIPILDVQSLQRVK